MTKKLKLFTNQFLLNLKKSHNYHDRTRLQQKTSKKINESKIYDEPNSVRDMMKETNGYALIN